MYNFNCIHHNSNLHLTEILELLCFLLLLLLDPSVF